MVTEIVVPQLGITFERGKLIRWLKSEGDFVSKGESIFEVETDKLVTEIESPATGVLRRILVGGGIEVAVLTVVGVIAEKEEELPQKYQCSEGGAISLSTRAPDSQSIMPSSSQPISTRAEPDEFDVAILGAGPGGYVAAIRAAQQGLRVILIEKSEVGGNCLNWGCIPTKCFLSDLKIYRKVREKDLFENGDRVSINLKKMVARKDRVVETLKRGILLLLQNREVRLVRGSGRVLDGKSIEVSSNGKTQRCRAKNVIIATGSIAASLPGIKTDGKRILSSDHVLDLKKVPKSILIVGGGVIGVEFATIFRELGAEVKVIELLPQIVSGEDEEVIRGLRMLLERSGIEILTEAKVLSTSRKKEGVEVILEKNGKQKRLFSDYALVAVGRTPFTDGLHLEKIGIQMEGRFIKVNSRMETNVDGVYAIGDVIGKMMLAHAASAEGIVAVDNIIGKGGEIDYQKIPNCIYTFPEVASVGLKEPDARQKGYDIRTGKFSYLQNGMALAIGESEGFVKIIAEKELGQILGVHILGEHATDLIGECLLAMKLEAAIEDLGTVVKGHPSLSEAVTEAALAWEGLAIHLPK